MNNEELNNELIRVRQELSESLKRETFLRSLCVAVRLAQVEYFATRSKQALVRSKGAENRLDKDLFGAPLKFKELTYGENGELIYGRNDTTNGNVSGASSEESFDERHTVSILGSGKSSADNR